MKKMTVTLGVLVFASVFISSTFLGKEDSRLQKQDSTQIVSSLEDPTQIENDVDIQSETGSN